MSNLQTWGGRIQRGLSFRVIILSLIGGAIVGYVASLAWTPLAVPVTLIAAAALWFGIVMNNGQMVTCDACKKRVKMGATTCHHCGYSRA